MSTPMFDSGGFRRSQENAVAVINPDGTYVGAGGGGGGGGLAQLQIREGAAWVNAPGTAAKGLLIEPAEGVAVDGGTLPTKLYVVAGYDGANVRSIKTTNAGVVAVSASALPLPSGAATEATLAGVKTGTDKIPASPAATADVQAVRDRLPAALDADGGLKTHVQNFPATQPVSGTVTVANPTTNPETGLAKDATLTGGTTKAINRGGAKGATTAADVTSTAEGADHQAMDVQSYHGGAAIDPRDVSDRAGRALGVVTGPLTDTQLRATAVPTDPSDRAARALGKVDAAVDHDAAATLPTRQVGGYASPVDVPPTSVSANGDLVRSWLDRAGAQVVRRRKIRETYSVIFRLAETAARLDQTFTQVANTNKQWATIYHAATATKEVRLQRMWLYITSDTVAGIQGVVELRELTGATPPATGNPAITPKPRRVGGAAAEAACLYLPTTQGSETAVNSPLGHVPFDTGISGAVSTANPVPVLSPVVLFDANAEDDEALQPVIPVATAGGWAAVIRTVGAPVLRCTLIAVFTEEVP